MQPQFLAVHSVIYHTLNAVSLLLPFKYTLQMLSSPWTYNAAQALILPHSVCLSALHQRAFIFSFVCVFMCYALYLHYSWLFKAFLIFAFMCVLYRRQRMHIRGKEIVLAHHVHAPHIIRKWCVRYFVRRRLCRLLALVYSLPLSHTRTHANTHSSAKYVEEKYCESTWARESERVENEKNAQKHTYIQQYRALILKISYIHL